jgi:hypothetical protein
MATHRTSRPLGSVWFDHALPVTAGLLIGFIFVREGGGVWTVLGVPALFWSFWQVLRRLEIPSVVCALLLTSATIAILVYLLLFFGVDTARLRQAIVDAGIGVNAVSGDRSGLIVSIQPVSWGPERNMALRGVFAAVHTHAGSKKRVSIQWSDGMTTTIQMKDIEAFVAGQISYKEILNRMDWSGTPNVLPEDTTTGRNLGLLVRPWHPLV